jgi:nitroimidazol reductase NimA-like FMN-containing flavoprotein (pyridoxamine 5'-phosphate oxidase superfamily)
LSTYVGGREQTGTAALVIRREVRVVQLSELHTLDRAECLELLRTVTVGRIAFTDGGLPAIQPVNFTVDGANVIIRTSGGGKLAAAVTGAMVAFEADEVDAATRSGWSVVVVGHASLIRDIDQLVALAGPDSRPWAPGRTGHVIRIKTERITGRRVVPA